MVNGDYHHFEDNGGPQKSINFIVAHDGFNLADLVSYQTKDNNQPYPFGPSDGGSDDNMSWDSGGDPALRRQRLRNLWAILMLSRGVPMVVAGDEFGRTQNGNNNPWALDSPAMRNNYAMIATSAPQRVAVEDGTGAAYHDNLDVFDSHDKRVNLDGEGAPAVGDDVVPGHADDPLDEVVAGVLGQEVDEDEGVADDAAQAGGVLDVEPVIEVGENDDVAAFEV